MNENTCDQYTEWMSLAQDGMLSSTQARLLHMHLAECPACQAEWDAMNWVSRVFHAAPLIAPPAGFVVRFQARLARLEERRRQAAVGVLLGVGVVTLIILALPSLVGLLCFTGTLVLPYEIMAYIQGLSDWTSIALRSLAEAAWVLVRNIATPQLALTCVGSAAMAGTAALFWMRFLWGRTKTQ